MSSAYSILLYFLTGHWSFSLAAAIIGGLPGPYYPFFVSIRVLGQDFPYTVGSI